MKLVEAIDKIIIKKKNNKINVSTKVTSRCSNLQKLRDSPMHLPQDSDLNVLLALHWQVSDGEAIKAVQKFYNI
jgi:hypothetical protein